MWDPLLTSETEADEPWSEDKAVKVKACLDYLYGQIGTLSSVLKNGSFEIYSFEGGNPIFNGWDVSLYPGGSYNVETDSPADGAAALKLTHPGGVGNGGGYVDSDYNACSPGITKTLGFIHWGSVSGMNDKVYVRFYDKSKVFISDYQLYSSTSNPTTPTLFQRPFTPPANTQFYKIRLIGGYTDTNQSGTAFFDGLWVDDSKDILIVKQSDQSITASFNTLVDDTELTFPLIENSTYFFEFDSRVTIFNGGSIAFAINGPASPAAFFYIIQLCTTGSGAASLAGENSYNSGDYVAEGTITTYSKVSGMIVTGANAGLLVARWLRSTTTTATVKAQSTLKIRKA